MERLEYVVEMVQELSKIADDSGSKLLASLLKLAVVVGKEEIEKQRDRNKKEELRNFQ